MAADFRQSIRHAANAEDVVGSVHEVRDGTNLEQTPSLIDADVAGDIRNMRAAVSIGTSSRGLDRTCRKACGGGSDAEVQHGGTVEHGRIIETDGGRHAIAELRGVLDVVDA